MGSICKDETSSRRASTVRQSYSINGGRHQLNALREAKQRATQWIRVTFEELVLRKKRLLPSQHGRRITLDPLRSTALIDERRGQAYVSNSIRSSRYNAWDFLPKQFFFQATRLSNFYFICVGILQAIPGFSTTGSFTTIIPVAFFIFLTILKEGYDDYRRHQMDMVENLSLTTVLRQKNPVVDEKVSPTLLSRTWSRVSELPSVTWSRKSSLQDIVVEELNVNDDQALHWTKSRWHDLQVGDVLKLERDDPIPADIVLLHASGENGIAYIETMALDGETNLKTKQTPSALLQNCSTIADLRSCKADFAIEDPNPNLYDFNGRVTVHGQAHPLTLNEVVYRGSVLRNTHCILGVVVNTGEECKIRMNANHHPKAKKPRLEWYANQIVLMLIAYVIIISVGMSVGYLSWHASTEQSAWYLNNASVPFKDIIVGFLIMFNNVIPLALYVSLEIVKIGQMLMIQSDVEMYDAESDTPMVCNTNTILENLGQISYVLSDKTGTLTENVMRFRGMSVDGSVWVHQDASNAESPTPNIDQEQLMENCKTPVSGFSEKVGDLERGIGTNLTKYEAPPPSKAAAGLDVHEHEVSADAAHEISTPPRMHRPWQSSTTGGININSPSPDRTTSDLLQLIHRDPQSSIACKARALILAMALCHTALPEVRDGNVDFQASSPDELALVRAARDLGVLLIERTAQKITLSIQRTPENVVQETYQILEVIEFSSKRKRMSVVVRDPAGRVCLICKGADNAIIPRLQQAELASRKSAEVRRSMDMGRHLQRKSEQHEYRNIPFAKSIPHHYGRSSISIPVSHNQSTSEVPRQSHETHHLDMADDSFAFRRCFQHLDNFATEGLRTLLFAHKYLAEDEFQVWRKAYREASTSLDDRQARIESAGETIEQGMELLGVSAIEDKLQKGVPETIDKLRRANIRVWMLTGDKRETAISVAHSTRICLPSSLIYILNSTKGDLHGQMTEILHDVGAHRVAVIDGHSLSVVDADVELKHLFYTTLIANVDSVIVCRASPAQKAGIAEGIRANLSGLTLAIGDGANDVAMIQAAHVGVGISRREGVQAARVADYSVAQFRFLQRLLLVHGRHSYARTAKFVLLTFWKEMFFYMMQALYQRTNGYSGTSLYENWSLTVLNTLFTSLCVIVPGIFEQDLRPETLLAVPELYVYGQRNQGLSLGRYAAWMILATVNGVVVWFVCLIGYAGAGHVIGNDNGLFALGDLVFTLGVLWTNWKICVIETNYKTVVVAGALLITFAGWWFWCLFMAGVYSHNLSPYDVKHGFTEGFGREPAWWLTLILGFLILSVMEIVYAVVKRYLQAERLWPLWKISQRKGVVGRDELGIEIWQEMEADPKFRERVSRMAMEQ